jgi:uncharacterized protein YrrD
MKEVIHGCQYFRSRCAARSAVIDRSGKKLGKVYSVYYDNESDRPEWVAVKSGLFGTHISLVPLGNAEFDGRELRGPYNPA